MDRATARTVSVVTIAFLGLLAAITAVAWAFQAPSHRSIETIYVVIALSPFVFYLFVSDKLKQFKGGGIELTLRDEASKEVTATIGDAPIEFVPAAADEKSGLSALQRMLDTGATTLAFIIGRSYARSVVQEYIDALSTTPAFRHVLFKDPDDTFRGYMPAGDFERLLRTADDLIGQIETGAIVQHPAVIRDTVAQTATNQQALRRMDALNRNELAVLDADDQFAGTITQEEIVRKILANVIRES